MLGTDNDAATSALWHGQAQMAAVGGPRRVIERGEGVHVWDEDGQRLLDLPASLWYCTVGHGRAEIGAAVQRQMGRIEAYSNFQQYATRPALELAEWIADAAPVDGAKVLFGSGGSDAVEIAAKLARRYWAVQGQSEKRTIVARERCYHGLHGFGTSLSGLRPNREGYGDLMPDVAHVPHDDWRALEQLALSRPGEIAAFFCEPILGTGGVIHPVDGYIDGIARVCREHDILLVVDEVVTGFGRTGRLFASDRYAIRPDMLLFAKGVTSGYLPLGGAVVSERVAEPFWRDGSSPVFRHGLTYQGHASVCAAAAANLELIVGERLPERAAELEGVLERGLRELESDPLVTDVRAGVGLLGGVQLRDATAAAAVVDAAWERGVLTRAIGDGDVIQVSPPLVIEAEQIAEAVAVLAESLALVGALPAVGEATS